MLRAEQRKICENEAQEPSVKSTTAAKVKKRMRLIRTWEFQIFTIGFCDELKIENNLGEKWKGVERFWE
jgi:hypothetical protein